MINAAQHARELSQTILYYDEGFSNPLVPEKTCPYLKETRKNNKNLFIQKNLLSFVFDPVFVYKSQTKTKNFDGLNASNPFLLSAKIIRMAKR